MKQSYKTIIGLEVHARLDTKSKMFCSCDNLSDGVEPNTNVCEICMGHPGSLPVANRIAIDWTLRSGLAFHCTIPLFSKFDRKNYFYPDLSKGYQISQYDLPFCTNGYLEVDGNKKIRIQRIHLEEDAAKNTHPSGEKYSFIDFNRAGTPLMEIVSEPDIDTPQQARQYMQELQKILRYLGVSRADMEKGHMRCDANINVKDMESGRVTGIIEIKNMNSFRSVERSLLFEEKRLCEKLESGEKLETKKATYRWDDEKGETFIMREKEEASDYRYFPEPDIPPFTFEKQDIETIKKSIPELPQEKVSRFQKEFGLNKNDAELLTAQKDRAAFFEQAVSELLEWSSSEGMKKNETEKLIQTSTNYIFTELLRYLKEKSLTFSDLKAHPEDFAELMKMTFQKEINSSATQRVLNIMIQKGGDPSEIVKSENLAQVSDEGELEKVVLKVIDEHEGPVKDFHKGKERALQFLIGMVMKQTHGKANPQIVKQLLEKLLKT